MGEETKQPVQAPPADEANKPAPPEEEKKQDQPPPPPPKPPSPFVLYVDLHCVGCAKKIERSIMKLRGVEGVVIDMVQNHVTIKGVVEPPAICNMIKKKTRRMAKLLSPLPPTEGEPIPEVIASQVSGLVTVELNVNMHCEACAEQLKKKILKMRGVQSADTEFSSGKVTVTGTMDADKLVDYVYRRTKKQARIVPQPEPEPEKPPEDPKPAGEPQNQPPAEEKKEESGHPPEEGEVPPAPEEEAKKDEGENDAPPAGENGEQGPPPPPVMHMPLPVPVMHMPLPLPAFAVEDEPMKRMMMYQYHYQPTYVLERIPPAPQLFSDENPNACCIS